MSKKLNEKQLDQTNGGVWLTPEQRAKMWKYSFMYSVTGRTGSTIIAGSLYNTQEEATNAKNAEKDNIIALYPQGVTFSNESVTQGC